MTLIRLTRKDDCPEKQTAADVWELVGSGVAGILACFEGLASGCLEMDVADLVAVTVAVEDAILDGLTGS